MLRHRLTQCRAFMWAGEKMTAGDEKVAMEAVWVRTVFAPLKVNGVTPARGQRTVWGGRL